MRCNLKCFIFITFALFATIGTLQSQNVSDSLKNAGFKKDTLNPIQLKSTVTVTNNGISMIPTFSIGKPAVIFDIAAKGKRLSFEPQLRFALEGKPWSFIFWWRYKLYNDSKWSISVGAHPAITFKNQITNINGINQEQLVGYRYLAGELAPNYKISKNATIGLYYMFSKNIETLGIKNNTYFTFNANITQIHLTDDIFVRCTPQVYYLKMDDLDGFYTSAITYISKKNCSLSISFLLNKAIDTRINTNELFKWNASIIYSH